MRAPQRMTRIARVQPADVLVVFVITGDLAKVMTFRSLYRLSAGGLLDCPIVGVAAQDWTGQEPHDHARTCIEGAVSEPVWGPAAGDGLLTGQGAWHESWVTA
jgi:glucose-6-phosphate 1-dehydrogenase